ncbi:MAG: HD domain-containing protein [Acidimicrobiia bacterium]|nr:HD domain-containing protein [Acidimicrobiia bacterium]
MTGPSQVGFVRMEDGTAEDYAKIDAYDAASAARQGERVLGWLRAMDEPSPYRITRLAHSLQTATRAEADGADEETVVCALLHDIGDELSPMNHSGVAAAVLRPYVSEKNHWIVGHHGLFQGYYWLHHYGRDRNERDVYADHPWYQDCVDFCARWDQVSFDPDYPTAPLAYFEPLVERLFDRSPNSFE